jgi:SAM-dependent methyltransferase
MRVLELGPGEDESVALRFLAAGAAQVTCVDRFVFEPDPDHERELHRLLRSELGPSLDGAEDRLEVLRGVGIEEAASRLGHERFDLIISVAVLEHVYDVAASLRAMDALLAPGGMMVHQVDLRDHGMFTAGGHDPLEFLTIGDRTYRLMTSHTGAPNRVRIGAYRELLDELGHDAEVLVTNVWGAREDLPEYVERLEVDGGLRNSIEAIRGRLAPRFASLPAEDLAVTGILIRSRKAVRQPARDTGAPSRRA